MRETRSWTAVALLCAASFAAPARAQLARAGDTVVASDVGPTKRLPAVAFDPVHGRWLVVWSLFPVGARFLARDATPLGAPFVVAEQRPEASLAPRVAYAPSLDAFLVTWLEEVGSSGRVRARLLRGDAAGTPTFLGGDVVVSDEARPKHSESSPSVSWSERSRTFLVAWADVEGDLDVRARRLDASATPIGEELVLSSGEAFDAFPVVALGEASDAWLVAWTYEPVTGGGAIAARAVSAGDGALGPEQVLYASEYENYPDIAYDSRRDRFFVASWHIGPGHDVFGRLASASGAPLGDVIAIAATDEFEGGDGIGLAYSREADAYVSVFQSTTTEIWASLVSGDGVPSPRIEVTRGARMGTYAPRIAAEDGAARWLLVTSADFDRIVAQALEAPSAPLPDGGVAMDGGGARDAGALDAALDAGDGGALDGSARPMVPGGCGCRAAQSRREEAVAGWAVLVLTWPRRRRARGKPTRGDPAPPSPRRQARER